VIVTWVDSPGPSPDVIAVGDVIETINGDAVPTVFAWTARTGRLVPGAQVRLRRHRAGATADVSVTASAAATPEVHLGLTLALSGDQSRVVRVAAGSAADQAGIRPGDLLSAVGASTALTPWELTRRFERLPPMGTMLLSVARGDEHHIVVLTR
jgi:S1-C subfamily serine protease